MPTMTLPLIRRSSISNSSEIFSYTTMYSTFVFLDRFLFELSCKNTHTQTQTHKHRDSNEYSIVAFSKNATIAKIIYRSYLNTQLDGHEIHTNCPLVQPVLSLSSGYFMGISCTMGSLCELHVHLAL